MNGMNALNGRSLTALDHLRQSIGDILTTRIGSRVMRRDYGSNLPALIDAPANGVTLMKIYAAIAEAIAKWEPRFRLIRVQAQSGAAIEQGQIGLDLTGEYQIELAGKWQPVTLEGLLIA